MRLRNFSLKRNGKLILLMQTEPGSSPGSGEALAKFSRNYAELYWEFNEHISRPIPYRPLIRRPLLALILTSFAN